MCEEGRGVHKHARQLRGREVGSWGWGPDLQQMTDPWDRLGRSELWLAPVFPFRGMVCQQVPVAACRHRPRRELRVLIRHLALPPQCLRRPAGALSGFRAVRWECKYHFDHQHWNIPFVAMCCNEPQREMLLTYLSIYILSFYITETWVTFTSCIFAKCSFGWILSWITVVCKILLCLVRLVKWKTADTMIGYWVYFPMKWKKKQ